MSMCFRLICIGFFGFSVSACVSSPDVKAPDFSNNWTNVNGYSSDVKVIPLYRTHVYKTMTIDLTLKGVLERWAREANTRLEYTHDSDYSLSTAVSSIQQLHLENAVADLNAVYEKYNVHIDFNNGVIQAVSAAPKDFSAVNVPLFANPVPLVASPDRLVSKESLVSKVVVNELNDLQAKKDAIFALQNAEIAYAKQAEVANLEARKSAEALKKQDKSRLNASKSSAKKQSDSDLAVIDDELAILKRLSELSASKK